MLNFHFYGKKMVTVAAAAIFVGGTGGTQGNEQDVRFTIPDSTLSADHRYGVSVPVWDIDNPKSELAHNKLIDTRTWSVLTVIRGETGFDRPLNHREVGVARWSQDDSVLRWKVDGKWTPDTLVLVKVQQGKVKWQFDLLRTAQQAILKRTREAVPKRYLAGKTANRGNGSAFPDGFTVNVTTEGDYDFVDHLYDGADGVDDTEPLPMPLRVRADLCSNLKWNDDMPELDSTLYGVIDANGNFTVTGFRILSHRRASGWPWHGLHP